MSFSEPHSPQQSFDSAETDLSSTFTTQEGKRRFCCHNDNTSISSDGSHDFSDLNQHRTGAAPPRFSDLFLPPFLAAKFSTAYTSNTVSDRAKRKGQDSGFVSKKGSGDLCGFTLPMESHLHPFLDGQTTDPDISSDHDDQAEYNERSPSPMLELGQSSRVSFSSVDGPASFDLNAPPPTSPPRFNVEHLAERLFSLDHLKVIVCDATTSARLYAFLKKYRPEAVKSLNRFLETQKALGALQYANSIAGSLSPGSPAATLDDGFIQGARESINEVVNDILPAYITHRLVLIVTEALVKEITGEITPVMKGLVPGLAEVYCITDPNLPDNPIVYASEEFYRYSGYSANYVIGRNCRFLQGPKTSRSSVNRLLEALADGTEIFETILNYRRDGKPFFNLLMIAPLHDNTGTIRYFIGAQLDVTKLIERGRGLDSFERLLENDKAETLRVQNAKLSQDPQRALEQLSDLFNESDLEILEKSVGKLRREGSPLPTGTHRSNVPRPRKHVGMDDAVEIELWPSLSLGPSGRLPGVFQSYMLVRPYPSLRVTFTSPSLRIPGLLQSKFMDHIGGPSNARLELSAALATGTRITARIDWFPQGLNGEVQERSSPNQRPAVQVNNTEDNQKQTQQPSRKPAKPRWIHCTPLVGSDNRVGVWMIVMVENEFVTGSLNVSERSSREGPTVSVPSKGPKGFEDLEDNSSPVSPTAGAGEVPARCRSRTTPQSQSAAFVQPPPDSPQPKTRQEPLQIDKLYRDYLRREGRPDSIMDGELVKPSAQA